MRGRGNAVTPSRSGVKVECESGVNKEVYQLFEFSRSASMTSVWNGTVPEDGVLRCPGFGINNVGGWLSDADRDPIISG